MSDSKDKPKCDVHSVQIGQLQKSDDDQWKHINKFQDALRKLIPVWVTVVLMASSFITGSALTFAGMIIKFSGK